jgi:hypothetical protein
MATFQLAICGPLVVAAGESGTSENAGSPDPVNVAIVEMIASAVQDKVRVHSVSLDKNFKGVLLGVAQAACEIEPVVNDQICAHRFEA